MLGPFAFDCLSTVCNHDYGKFDFKFTKKKVFIDFLHVNFTHSKLNY